MAKLKLLSGVSMALALSFIGCEKKEITNPSGTNFSTSSAYSPLLGDVSMQDAVTEVEANLNRTLCNVMGTYGQIKHDTISFLVSKNQDGTVSVAERTEWFSDQRAKAEQAKTNRGVGSRLLYIDLQQSASESNTEGGETGLVEEIIADVVSAVEDVSPIGVCKFRDDEPFETAADKIENSLRYPCMQEPLAAYAVYYTDIEKAEIYPGSQFGFAYDPDEDGSMSNGVDDDGDGDTNDTDDGYLFYGRDYSKLSIIEQEHYRGKALELALEIQSRFPAKYGNGKSVVKPLLIDWTISPTGGNSYPGLHIATINYGIPHKVE